MVDEAAAGALSLVTVVLVIVGWPTFIETSTRGRSLGKYATGLRVVRNDGSTVELPGSAKIEMNEGDVFIIETPGGGGYGPLRDKTN